MPRKRKTKKAELKERFAEETRQEKEAEAENRRKLLASLDPDVREFTRQEFAKLGLYQ